MYLSLSTYKTDLTFFVIVLAMLSDGNALHFIMEQAAVACSVEETGLAPLTREYSHFEDLSTKGSEYSQKK